MNVCVTGATGFVGGRLVPALLDAGHTVTALVRDASRYDPPEDVTVVEGDLLEPESFEVVVGDGPAGERDLSDLFAALDVDVVYYLVHSMQAGGEFEERDRRAAHNFQRAADAVGVERVVYLGGLGGEGDRLSEHLRSRREVEWALREGEYDCTVLRAAIIVGNGSASFEIVYQLAQRLPVMVTPLWVRTPGQPIAIADVVAYLVGVLDAPETADGTFEIGGPDVLTYEEMLERTADILGRRLFVVPVPVLSPRLSSYWLALVTDVDLSVARPLVEGLRNPVVVTDDSIREYVSIDPTPFDVAVRRALAEKGVHVEARPA